jgi:hypothetical protein
MQQLHRSVIVQVGHIGVFSKSKVWLGDIQRSLHAGLGLNYLWNREFRTSLRMMVDTSATEKGVPIVDVLPEKDEDGGFASGGWKRLIWASSFIIFGLNVLNHNLSQKLKFIGMGKFNHLINTLTLSLTCRLKLPFNR